MKLTQFQKIALMDAWWGYIGKGEHHGNTINPLLIRGLLTHNKTGNGYVLTESGRSEVGLLRARLGYGPTEDHRSKLDPTAERGFQEITPTDPRPWRCTECSDRFASRQAPQHNYVWAARDNRPNPEEDA